MAEPTERQQVADSPADYEALLARLVVPADAHDQIRRAIAASQRLDPEVAGVLTLSSAEQTAEIEERLRLLFVDSHMSRRWSTVLTSAEVWALDVDLAARTVLDLVCGWFDQRPPAEPASAVPTVRRRRWRLRLARRPASGEGLDHVATD